jgi:hypothetical protein
LLGRGHIGAQCHGLPTDLSYLVRNGFNKVLIACAQYDGGTLASGHFRQCLSKPWTNPTDHHHFIFEQQSTTS